MKTNILYRLPIIVTCFILWVSNKMSMFVSSPKQFILGLSLQPFVGGGTSYSYPVSIAKNRSGWIEKFPSEMDPIYIWRELPIYLRVNGFSEVNTSDEIYRKVNGFLKGLMTMTPDSNKLILITSISLEPASWKDLLSMGSSMWTNRSSLLHIALQSDGQCPHEEALRYSLILNEISFEYFNHNLERAQRLDSELPIYEDVKHHYYLPMAKVTNNDHTRAVVDWELNDRYIANFGK